jgi:hypothetical protein
VRMLLKEIHRSLRTLAKRPALFRRGRAHALVRNWRKHGAIQRGPCCRIAAAPIQARGRHYLNKATRVLPVHSQEKTDKNSLSLSLLFQKE